MRSKKIPYGSKSREDKQETIEETNAKIKKVLDKLDNLEEEEGGDPK